MADVKWIKITTDIFDDEKILLIESLPDAYAIIVVWFKLLCLAGKQNNSGVFMMNNQIAYTDKMLATIFRMKESTVQMALQTFEQFGMVELIDGVITIPNWSKHQSLDAYEKKKERDRLYRSEKRAAQRALIGKSSDASLDRSSDRSSDVVVLEGDKEEDRDKEIEERSKNSPTDYSLFQTIYNDKSKVLPKCKTMTDKRKKLARDFLKTFSYDQWTEICERANRSEFLTGRNDRGWKADIDFLLRTDKAAKILEGFYEKASYKDRYISDGEPDFLDSLDV